MVQEKRKQREMGIMAFVKDEAYRPMRIREMAHVLGVPKKERGEFHEILEHMINGGSIVLDAKGRIGMPQENVLAGSFMATRKGFGFVRTEDGGEDIFVPEHECGGAFHGDRVLVLVKKGGKNGKKREGTIVRIIERGCTSLVGTFSKNGKITFVIPDSEKITKDIYIPKGKTLGAVHGHKVMVEVDDFGSDEKSPEGHVVEILGHPNDPGVDILSIVRGFGLPEEFPDNVMRQAADIPEEVLSSQMAGRLDIRNYTTVTIDGEDAKDLDDAISIEKYEDGSFELGVHIADVSHYVTEGSALDKEALARGTSVYLADRVIPMLPHKLSNGICSLNEGEDRLALSCFMNYDSKGVLKSHRILETVICVKKRMSYTDVNDILMRTNEETSQKYKELIPVFEIMQELAAILRRGRGKKGAVDFDFPECRIVLDEKGCATDIRMEERNVATGIIEEFMLAANQVVAEEYFWMEIPFLYRTHEYPDPEKIRELAVLTSGFGYHIKTGKEEIHPREIRKLLTELKGTPEEAFLSRLTLRAMKKARYTVENSGHFGLATSYYCHFTSPIRRYPDLQIHRIIKENIRHGIRGKRLRHYEEILPAVAVKSSERERMADDAEREVNKMKKAEYMQGHIGEIEEGIISGVTSWGIYVELPNTIEGMVRISDMNDDIYEYEENGYRVKGHYTGKAYSMGQKTIVQVIRADKGTGRVDFIFVDEEGKEDVGKY